MAELHKTIESQREDLTRFAQILFQIQEKNCVVS